MTGYYFTCRICRTWAVTITPDTRHVPCNGCRAYKKFMYAADINQKVYDYAKQYGIAHLPLPDDRPKPCTRCGETFESAKLRFRMGGLVCEDCYKAEARPVEPLTPELIAERLKAHDEKVKADREWERFGMYERQDAAGEKQ